MRLGAIVALSLLMVSCDQPAIDPSQSLVGAKSLPAATELARERVEIHFGYDTVLANQLSFELHPDDSWIVRISEAKDLQQSNSQKFQLDSKLARTVRAKLWRVRPEELKGVEWVVEPADCPPPPTDASPLLSVAFIAEGPQPGVGDDRVGIFILPRADICNTPQATAARKLLEEVLKPSPGSNLASKYQHYPPLP